MINEIKFCCWSLEQECRVLGRQRKQENMLLIYVPKWRCFGIAIGRRGANMPIHYCPFCGTKLPTELGDEYWEVIIKECGEEYYHTSEIYDPSKKLPLEFRTDEWWRKRHIQKELSVLDKPRVYEENIEVVNGERVLKL